MIRKELNNKEVIEMDYSTPIPITHPGIILQEEFLNPYSITQSKLAELLKVTNKTVNEICTQKRGVSPSMALKLSRLFGTTPQFWLNFQSGYDLYKTYEKEKEAIEQVKRHIA